MIQSVYTALDGVAEKFKGMGYKLEDIKGVGKSIAVVASTQDAVAAAAMTDSHAQA